MFLLLACALSTSHVVHEGDTLAEIAERYGTTVEAIQKENNIDDPDSIRVGDILLISSGEDSVIIRMGNSIFSDDIRYAGSAFMAICWIGKINDAAECQKAYDQVVGEKSMRSDGWVNNWTMTSITKASSERMESCLYECKDNEKEILECRSASGSHYVVGNGRDSIVYDPMYDEYVSYTDCVAKHIYTFEKTQNATVISDEL